MSEYKIAQLILQKSQIESEKQIKVSSIQSSLSNLQSNNQNIINESNNLTSQSGNLKQYSFNDFNSFKSTAEDLKYEFDDYVSSENTYGLIEAAKIISEETSLYNNLVRVYSSGLLPEVIDNNDELPQYQDDETNYDKIQKPRQLINWINNRIKSQTIKIDNKRVKLQEKFTLVSTGFDQAKNIYSSSLKNIYSSSLDAFQQFVNQFKASNDAIYSEQEQSKQQLDILVSTAQQIANTNQINLSGIGEFNTQSLKTNSFHTKNADPNPCNSSNGLSDLCQRGQVITEGNQGELGRSLAMEVAAYGMLDSALGNISQWGVIIPSLKNSLNIIKNEISALQAQKSVTTDRVLKGKIQQQIDDLNQKKVNINNEIKRASEGLKAAESIKTKADKRISNIDKNKQKAQQEQEKQSKSKNKAEDASNKVDDLCKSCRDNTTLTYQQKQEIQYKLEQNNIIDDKNNLTPDTINKCFLDKKYIATEGSAINNPKVINELTKDRSNINDWNKYKTDSITTSVISKNSTNINPVYMTVQIHFYGNPITGKVNYTIDYKVKTSFGNHTYYPLK